MMGEMDAYRDAFLAESADYLQQITDGLLELEARPNDSEPVEVVFRGAHSLKGMSAAMRYDRTADLTHKMESAMSAVRSGDRPADRTLVELMLAAVDLVRDLIEDESTGKHLIDPTEMMDALQALKQPVEQPDAGSPTTGTDATAGPSRQSDAADGVELKAGERIWRLTVQLEDTCVLKAVRAYMVIKRLSRMGTVIETVPPARDIEDEHFDRSFEVVVASSASEDDFSAAIMQVLEVAGVTAERLEQQSKQQASAPTVDAGLVKPKRGLPKLSETQTVRVSIGHLDKLVDLVGELVILRSRLDRVASSLHSRELEETLDELHQISTDLQYEVMQTRMVPVGNIFNRFPRMVRDLAIELGKQVDFQMEGLDIELDRTVLDEIGDPLVHLLRNGIDHGIEDAAERMAAGKSAVGRIVLSARRERDHVEIVVSDDGKGIDPDRIWSKALQRGMVRSDERPEYSDGDILLLTCVSGFSTAEKATKVSGRGVGMDVVKGKIEHLGGSLRIESAPDAGTAFHLRLPFTLAITQALLVDAGNQTFALALGSVEEVFSAEELTPDTIDGHPVLLLRDGSVVPLHHLDAILFDADSRRMPPPGSSVVVMRDDESQNALCVDAITGRQEIVIKPLSGALPDSRGFSGATVLGDGRVLLILDPRTIFSLSED